VPPLALPLALCLLALGPAIAEANSRVAGDFDGDGHDDLAVGVNGEDFFADDFFENAGAVNVIYGSASRLTAEGNQLWNQNSAGIADRAETGDVFGWSLSAGDFNGSGHDDLAVGVPGEGLGSLASAGAVNVLYGAGVGLRADGNQLWHQDSPGIVDTAEEGDTFGAFHSDF
jgi:FG-GAP repeat